MQVVKVSVCFLFISIYLNSHGQELSGEFQRTDPATVARDRGVTYHFGKDKDFKRTISKHLEEKEIQAGRYEVEGDTLYLIFKNGKQSREEQLDFSQKEKLSSSAGNNSAGPVFTKIRVLNSNGVPQEGVHLVLQNVEGDPVMAFSSDKAGKFPDLSIYDNYIKTLQLSYLGHQDVNIATDSLFGYRTTLDVHLKDSAINEVSKGGTEKYLIRNYTFKGFELVPLGSEQQGPIVLTRIF